MPSLVEVAYFAFFGKCWRVNSFARLTGRGHLFETCTIPRMGGRHEDRPKPSGRRRSLVTDVWRGGSGFRELLRVPVGDDGGGAGEECAEDQECGGEGGGGGGDRRLGLVALWVREAYVASLHRQSK